MGNLLRYLPSNLQMLAKRQHEELEALRAKVPALQQQIVSLQADLEFAEQQVAMRQHWQQLAFDMERERDGAIDMLTRWTMAGLLRFTLAGLASGFLAVLAIWAWGW